MILFFIFISALDIFHYFTQIIMNWSDSKNYNMNVWIRGKINVTYQSKITYILVQTELDDAFLTICILIENQSVSYIVESHVQLKH